ncbi:MAG: response regulator [Candidatus Vecturithrix sp.]|jgi:YesN/AraC family two-component response regulator|nr:response regulator [Candidatus Vecturithrix sp.]
MNILLIDDEANLLKLLRRPLIKYGHSITEALNGKEGWELFLEHSHQFDVIVTDIKMPVLNGVELLKRLREKEYDTPVIIITGYEDMQSSIDVLRLGAFDFLLKPFKARELIAILEKLEAVQENKKKQFTDLPYFHEHIEICIQSQTQLITTAGTFLQNRVKSFCQLHKINVRNIGLCLHEALVNAIIHGNLEISSAIKNENPEKFELLVKEREASPEYAEREVIIRCEITAEQVTFEIQDEGKGFDPNMLRFSDPLHIIPTGRGIFIITSFMDQVFWNEKGNIITMIKYLQSPELLPRNNHTSNEKNT